MTIFFPLAHGVALARRSTGRAMRAFPWSKAPHRLTELRQLVFRSQATRPMSPEDLERLLEHSRYHNKLYGLTGMVLYHEGQFIQCLEGPEKAVLDTFARIERDPRHHSVDELLYRPVRNRSFAGWSLATTRAERSAILRLSTAEWEFFRKIAPRNSPGMTLLQRMWGAYRGGATALAA